MKTSFKRSRSNEKAELAATLFVVVSLSLAAAGAISFTSTAPPAIDVAPVKTENNEVDPTLTAERAFAIDEKGNIQYGVRYDFRDPKDVPPTAFSKLSKDERAKYHMRRLHGVMADVVLYRLRCRNILPKFAADADRIMVDFKKLPENIQKGALAHEYAAIEARQPYDNPELGVSLPGGWEFFCDVMHHNSRDGISLRLYE